MTPETSFGYSVIDFALTTLKRPLDAWQRWLVIHAGELLPDGRPRFKEVMVLVARQNGKTELLRIMALWWLFVEFAKVILGVSSKVEYAKESWQASLELARQTPRLAAEIPTKGGIRTNNGEVTLTTVDGCRYKIAAANDDAGRSLTVHRLILDELRRMFDWTAYNAAIPTMNAVPDAQAWMLSNQGDHRSIVLRSLRKSAIMTIKDGTGNQRFGLFEWSAPPGSDPTDVVALALANPNVGRRIEWDSILGTAERVKEAGGEELAGFQIEIMCMEVDQVNPAVDPVGWADAAKGGDLSALRDRIAMCLDISLDGLHATLTAAARRDDGTVVADVVKAWAGRDIGRLIRSELPDLVARVKPKVFGWFPNGPAAAVAPDLAKRKRPRPGEAPWPPRRVELIEITGDATDACMGLAELVGARQFSHGGDALLDAHVLTADKLAVGERWRFTRRGAGHVDGAYSVAGAAHLARGVIPRKSIYAAD